MAQPNPPALLLPVAAALPFALGCVDRPIREAPTTSPVQSRTPMVMPPPAAPGGHALTGTVQIFETTTPGPADLCVDLVDPEPRAFGGDAEVLLSTTTDAGGQFSFTDLPVPASIGWVLVVDSCDETTTYVPTGTILSGELVGGRGASDTVSVTAWLMPTDSRDAIDEGLATAGSTAFLDDGGLVGHSLAESGSPHQDSWVRGPMSTQLWYPHASGSYELFDGTEAAAGGLYVAPAAERVYGVWVARVSREQFEPLMAGGFPGVVLVHDFVSWTPRVASPP